MPSEQMKERKRIDRLKLIVGCVLFGVGFVLFLISVTFMVLDFIG